MKAFASRKPLPCSLELSKKRIVAPVLCSLGLSGISFLVLLFVEHAPVPMGILAEAYEDFSTMWNEAEEAGYSWVCLSTVAIGPILRKCCSAGLSIPWRRGGLADTHRRFCRASFSAFGMGSLCR